MAFTYKPLWKMLIDMNMTKKAFRERTGISLSTVNSMGRDEYISMKIIDDICNEFHCTPNDVIRHIPDVPGGGDDT